MLPGTVLYVVGADAVTSAVSERRVPWILIWVFAFTAVLIIILVRQARKKLKGDEERKENE
jgi:membrane protein implicated in regulation of membrane protease activity